MTCPNCGIANDPRAVFCSQCGQQLSPSSTQPVQSPQARYAVPQLPVPANQPAYAYNQSMMAPRKDPQTGMILELLGLFGLLGIGHIYGGRTGRGVALLLGWWGFLVVELLLMFILVGLCLTPLNIALPILSGLWIKRDLERPRLGL